MRGFQYIVQIFSCRDLFLRKVETESKSNLESIHAKVEYALKIEFFILIQIKIKKHSNSLVYRLRILSDSLIFICQILGLRCFLRETTLEGPQ